MAISAQEVKKLRDMTGAGMMDCKKALEEANGDYDQAVTIIRKKGQLVAAKRADRVASEGCVLARVSADKTFGVVVALGCETDFVAKGADFVKLTEAIAAAAIENEATSKDAVETLFVNGVTVAEAINEKVAVIGEKIELSYFAALRASELVAYVHAGNKKASLVGFNKNIAHEVGYNVAMQITAMQPVAVDKNDVPEAVLKNEKDVVLGQMANDPKMAGKPQQMLEKIAEGKLDKFFKEKTLLNQEYFIEPGQTVRQYLAGVDKDLTVKGFLRFALGE